MSAKRIVKSLAKRAKSDCMHLSVGACGKCIEQAFEPVAALIRAVERTNLSEIDEPICRGLVKLHGRAETQGKREGR